MIFLLRIIGSTMDTPAEFGALPDLSAVPPSPLQQLKLHVAGNQPGTATLDGFDQARLQRVIDILKPIAAAQGKATKPNLSPPTSRPPNSSIRASA